MLSRDTWPDLVAEIRLRTNRQLRRPHPNPWEVGWILWHYTSDQRFYYIVLKPNGWELGKADPGYPGDQRFLATAPHPVFPPGRWYTVRVTQRGDGIEVDVDGRRLVRFTDQPRPLPVRTGWPVHRGRIGDVPARHRGPGFLTAQRQ